VHNTELTSQPFTFPVSPNPQVINLGHMGIVGGASAPVVKNAAGSTTYVENTDYVVDYVNGLITQKTGTSMTVNATVHVTFYYSDPSQVADSDLVGAVTSGVYTGMQLWSLAYGQFGFFPKILISPAAGPSGAGIQSVGSQDPAVASALHTLAAKMRGVCLIDSAPATAVAAAISNRSTSGQAFDDAQDRDILCFPWVLFDDIGLNPVGVTIGAGGAAVEVAMNAVEDSPLSQWMAGVMAATDLEHGYWFSPSNELINGILGTDVAIYSSILDSNSDGNNLNAIGIVTVFSQGPSGQRIWGNRSSAFPTATTPNVFIPIRRTLDVVEESAQLAMLQFMDGPITNSLITAILQSISAFIRSLIQQGALVPGGNVSFNPVDNPANQIANGQLVFEIDVMPPPPAERITFNVYVDISQLSNLTASSGLASQSMSA